VDLGPLRSCGRHRWMAAWEASGPRQEAGGKFWGRGAEWIIGEHDAGWKPCRRRPPTRRRELRGASGLPDAARYEALTDAQTLRLIDAGGVCSLCHGAMVGARV
jgi:hypothetical protein